MARAPSSVEEPGALAVLESEEEDPPSEWSTSGLRAASEQAEPGTPREDPSDTPTTRVAVTVYTLSGVDRWDAFLDPDATIGQLLSRLRKQTSEEEFRQFVERGHLVLLGEQSQHRSSWPLNDAYARVMMTGDVQRTLRAGGRLEFTVTKS